MVVVVVVVVVMVMVMVAWWVWWVVMVGGRVGVVVRGWVWWWGSYRELTRTYQHEYDPRNYSVGERHNHCTNPRPHISAG